MAVSCRTADGSLNLSQRSPVLATRTVISRLAGRTSIVLALAACAILAAWLTGHILTDRHHWSQYLYWVPTFIFLTTAAAAWVASLITAIICRKLPRATTPPRPAKRLRLIALVGWILCIAFMVTIQWRIRGIIIHPKPAPPEKTLQIVYWNPSDWDLPDFDKPVLAHLPDLAIIANPPPHRSRRNPVPPTDQEFANAMGPEVAPMRIARSLVLSRDPILRYASTTLGLKGVLLEPGQGRVPDRTTTMFDPGYAAFLEIDTTPRLGRTIIIWIIDLPSDIKLGRWETTQTAAKAIANFTGQTYGRAEDGTLAPLGKANGFPAPDIIIGDFNIPRGSASLKALTRNTTNAYNQAGTGTAWTYPRTFPLAHIDQMFIGKSLRTTSYKIIDPEMGKHRMQVVGVTGR